MIKKRMKILAVAAFSMALATGQQAMAAEDMPAMDHSSMPGMDHGSTAPAPANSDGMRGMDHSKMNHNAPAQADDMQGMDHSGGGEMKGMSMQGGAAPAEARDPHDYSGGYDFGMLPRHHTGDVAYRSVIKMDRLENVQTRDNAFTEYDLQAWLGKDYERLTLKAEGEVDEGELHEASTELLWGHALAPYWDSQLGVRHDSGEAPDRQWLALGIQGLAPYWFEVDATAYVSEQGHSALNLEAEYELLLTQKLVLQPRLEATLYGRRDAARELGSGLSDLSAGLRLRYEIRREFAPYLGVEWNGKFGGTANYARASGERRSETRIVAGVRFWY